MDEKILKTILCSCETVTKDLEVSDDYQSLVQEKKFLPKSDIIFNAVSTSLTKLLSYKISKQLYQRYSVRIHIINILRDWCRIADDFGHLRAFTDERQVLKFIENLLEKYLTPDILDNCVSDENLLPMTSALMCLACRNSHYVQYIERLLTKLSQLESSEESEKLLCYAVQKSSGLNLSLHTIEDIYVSQKHKLIEVPLLDDFISMCNNVNKSNNVNNSEDVHMTDQLIDFICRSSCIFQIVCTFLKELLMQLDYAPAVINFIQIIMKRIQVYCENQNKNILDLYPRKLQPCVILLQIDPLHHIHDSKEGTLQMLENIFTENKDVVIILLSHFPTWLKPFTEHLIRNSEYL